MGFERSSGGLGCDGVGLGALAEEHGTPLYIYSGETLLANIRRARAAFDAQGALIAYSIKACSNLALLRLAVREGCGLDIVSVGELRRALAVGADASTIIFAGVGKRRDEIAEALDAGIGMFNVESVCEIEAINAVATERGKRAPIALRVNPNVRADTHHHITTGTSENKFGIDLALIERAVEAVRGADQVDLVGLHCHIGSQILDVAPFARAAERVAELAERLRGEGHPITHLNFGGGHGIAYEDGQTALDPAAVAAAFAPIVERLGVTPILELGRSLVGPAGVLLTRVTGVKRGVAKTFVIVDAAMNDLLRPSLYTAHHGVEPVSDAALANETTTVDVVGPICESGDFIAKDRALPLPAEGDLLAVRDAGAYGMTMASNYNTRPRPAEVLVLDGAPHLVRRRETIEELFATETVPSALR